MEKEQVKIAIVGHIDHGKSTLIGRLFYDTASLPSGKMQKLKEQETKGKKLEFAEITDHLQEERDQGITIDTAQAFFKTKKRDFVIIDAPGHKEFLKNMMTGASQADTALLIVSAIEGVEEQTKRHALILSLLGLKNVIITINKMDAVEYKQERFNEVKKQVINFFEQINLKADYIIPISAKAGDNITKKLNHLNWFEGKSVLDTLDEIQIRKKDPHDMRFAVQDVYEIKEKSIIIGRVESGILNLGEKIAILPEEKEGVISSIEEFEKKDVKTAEKNAAIGITIKSDYKPVRGDIICPINNKAQLTTTLTSEIIWLSNKDLKVGDSYSLKLATQDLKAKIIAINEKKNSSTLEKIKEDIDTLKDTEIAKVTLKISDKLVYEDFSKIAELGRFVLEENEVTVCAGIITK